jgi:hypothetical protein
MNNPNEITYFAETDARNRRVTFGIKAEDRNKHVYVIGKTGMGKSTLLENMAAQDIRNGNGFAFMDPHGSAIDTLIEYIPKERIKDVIYFAPFDMEFPIAFNVMEDVGYDKRHLVVSGLMSTFKKIWQDAWSARMEYILANTLLALLEYPNATLLEVNKMLSDKSFRKKVVDNVTDPAVKSFWVDEFAKYTERMAAEATPAIQNKIGQFTANPLIRNIIGQPKSSFDMRKIMDEKKILLVNLSKGRIGESNASLLGSMLITKLYLAALSRADVGKAEMKELPNFYVYVDEFQSFANESFADILSEARKYKLNLTIAHQYIEQMSDEVRAAVFGNVGTMVSFRVGSFDGDVLEKEFAPTFLAEDIVNLGFAQIYLRLMIDGIGSQPFSAKTLPPLELPEISYKEEIIGQSRQDFAFPRLEVESFIGNIHNDGKDENKNNNNGGGNNGGGNNRNSGGGGQKNQNGNSGKNNNGGNHSSNGHGNSEKKEGNDNGKKPRTKPVIDKEKETQLQDQLKAFQARKKLEAEMIEKDDRSGDDLKGISLKDMTLNTRSGAEKREVKNSAGSKSNYQAKDFKKKEPSVGHKNDLKSALSDILGDMKKGEKKEEKKTDAPTKTAVVEKVAVKVEPKIEPKIEVKEELKVEMKEEIKKDQKVPHESKKESQKDNREIPEDELRKILEV